MTPEYPEYKEVRKAIARVRRQWKRVHVGSGLLLFICVLLAALLVAVGMEMLLFLPPAGLRLALGAAAVAVGLAFLLGFARRLTQNRSQESVALLVERAYPEIDNGLINAVQLAHDATVICPDLVRAAMRETLHRVEAVRLANAVDRRRMKRYGVAALVLAAIAALVAVVWPDRALSAGRRLLRPSLNQGRIGSVVIVEVKPGDRTGTDALLSGNALGVTARIKEAPGLDLDGAIEYLEEGDTRWRTLRMRMVDDTSFQGELRGVKKPFVYRVRLDGSASRDFKVEVVEPPRVTGVDVAYQFPAYTGKKPERVSDTDGAVRAVPGTQFTVTLHSDHRLKKAILLLGTKQEELPLALSEDRMAATHAKPLTIREDSTYALEIHDERGHRNRSPIQRQIRALPDAKPSVKLLLPGRDVTVPPGGSLTIQARATDDFGLAKAELWAVLKRSGTSGKYEPIHAWKDLPREKRVSLGWTWVFDPKNYVSGDVLRYYVKVTDNNDVGKPGVGESAKLEVRILDEKQAQKEKAERYGTWQERLQRVLEDQLDLRKDTATLEKRVGGAPKPAPAAKPKTPAPVAAPKPKKPTEPAKPTGPLPL